MNRKKCTLQHMTSYSYKNSNMLIFKHRHSKITGKPIKIKQPQCLQFFSPMVLVVAKWKIPDSINSFIKWYQLLHRLMRLVLLSWGTRILGSVFPHCVSCPCYPCWPFRLPWVPHCLCFSGSFPYQCQGISAIQWASPSP